VARHPSASGCTSLRRRSSCSIWSSGFFADLTGDVIRAGSFASVKALIDDINTYLSERNANPKPYTWTAKGEAILEKIHRARAALAKAEAV